MTAKTAASHVATRVLQNPTNVHTSWTWGKLAATTYTPAQVVYQSAKGVWTIQASNAGHLYRTGVIGDYPRTDSSFARQDVDNQVGSTSVNFPIITSGICVVKITDQNATIAVDQYLILSGTAGSLTIATDATLWRIARCIEAVADDDTFALLGIGLFLWLGE